MEGPSRETESTATEACDLESLYPSVPLNHANRETRFLRLYQDHDGSGIRGTLFAQSLDDKPRFYALSHVFGLSEDEQVIELNNRRVAIPQSLFNAIGTIFCTRSRARQSKPLTLWIDWICINHDDMAERSVQAALSPDIYFAAVRLLIWLGNLDEHETFALVVARELAIHRSGLSWEEAIGSPLPQVKLGFKELELLTNGPTGDSLLRGLKGICARPWFRHAWILQGVSLCRAVPMFLCRSTLRSFGVCWDCFCLGFRILYHPVQHAFEPSLTGASLPLRRWAGPQFHTDILLDYLDYSRNCVQGGRAAKATSFAEALWVTSSIAPTTDRKN
jgi:hypothetical protein